MRRSFAVVVAALAACGSDGAEPAFPDDYAASYGEVRDCRGSSDHDLNQIRVVADPATVATYLARDADFPAGAVVLKPEYDFADPTCAGAVVQWTVMLRDPPGGPAERLGWTWQRVGADREVISENDDERCYGCHASCGVPPDGYLGTCTVP